MIHFSTFNDGDHGRIDLPNSLLIIKRGVFDALPATDDIIVERCGQTANVCRVQQTHNDDTGEATQLIPWLDKEYILFKVQPMFKLDLRNEDVPGGPMAKTYAKGAAAAVAGQDYTSFDGTPGTAVHTVWLKGWFFNYLLAR